MSSMALKLIAVVCMAIDHIGSVMQKTLYTVEYSMLAINMRMVGRIAFPIYVFLIAEGMRKTRSRPNYLLWLGTFALISTIPFSYFNNAGTISPPFDFSYHNVFYTLFLGAASIYLFDLIRGGSKKLLTSKSIFEGKLNWLAETIGHFLGFAAPAALAYVGHVLNSDYGRNGWGVLVIFACYYIMTLKDNRFLRVIPLFLWIHFQYPPNVAPGTIPYLGWPLLTGMSPFALFATFAPLLIILYDGTPGTPKLRGRFKLAFYMFYPTHLLVLYAWSIFLR